MRPVACLFHLVAFLLPLPAQSIVVPAALLPFRINRLLVDNMPAGGQEEVRILGRSFDGKIIPLFETRNSLGGKTLSCYLYLDETFHAIEVEVKQQRGGKSVLFQAPVERDPYRMAVFSREPALILEDARNYLVVSPEELGPGDLYLLSAAEATAEGQELWEKLLKRGVHLLLPENVPHLPGVEAEEGENPWRGKILAQSTLEALLAKRKSELYAFKDRYRDLMADAGFHGIRLKGEPPYSFRQAKPADIAHSLEQEAFSSRLRPGDKLVLLCFYFPVLLLAAFLKQGRTLLALVALFLLLFVGFSLLYPGRDRILTVGMNVWPAGQEILVMERAAGDLEAGAPLRGLLSRSPEEVRYTTRGYSEGSWRLHYSMVRSYQKRLSLELLLEAEYIRFNQIPRITLSRDGYFLEYTGTLRSWSLHEPK